MLGAIVGDIVGSPYEFTPNNIKTENFPLFKAESHATDDTVMTLAVAEALMQSWGGTDEEIRAALIASMRAWGKAYPYAGYGKRFILWLNAEHPRPYHSYGNGSAMRVSSAAWLASSLEEACRLAELSALVTHNHPEGVKGAVATAAAIFMARLGESGATVRAWVKRECGYDLSRRLEDIRPGYVHVESCQETVPEAITAALSGKGFEDVIRKAVSLGGDSDTLTAIAGSIAEGWYPVPAEMEREVLARLDERQKACLASFRRFCAGIAG